MKYAITDLERPPKEIFHEIIESTSSQLLVPPQYSKNEVEIRELDSKEKSIGLFSSGTTASPKCIWNTLHNLIENGKRTAQAFEIEGRDRLLILAKPWHVAGLSWALMAEELGCEYDFITTNKGESSQWFEAIKSFNPDYLLTVPPVLRAIYGKKWFVPNIVFGGAPFEFEDFSLLSPHCEVMYQGYGQTEAGGLIACHKHFSSEHPKSNEHLNCGEAIEGVELKTYGNPDDTSDIYIKSETAFIDEWYKTGDHGFLEKNDIHILGRIEKVIAAKN